MRNIYSMMKRLTNISLKAIALVGIIATALSCDGPKAIPDKDLVNIFHDAFLANAYISESKITEDSLLLYEPILERYGYNVEDMRFTVHTIASRKSTRLSDLVSQASSILEEESKLYNYQLMVLDTIDNVAERRYTRIVAQDTLIRVRKLSDSTKLHIVVGDLIPAEYSITFDYFIDTLDENRNSRVEAYFKTKDDKTAMRHTMMLSRYREGKYNRKFKADTSHLELHINMFYHPENEELKRPDIRITNFKITRIIPTEQAVDSLYLEQMGALIFNHKAMTSYGNEKKPVAKATETPSTKGEKPSSTKRSATNDADSSTKKETKSSTKSSTKATTKSSSKTATKSSTKATTKSSEQRR